MFKQRIHNYVASLNKSDIVCSRRNSQLIKHGICPWTSRIDDQPTANPFRLDAGMPSITYPFDRLNLMSWFYGGALLAGSAGIYDCKTCIIHKTVSIFKAGAEFGFQRLACSVLSK